MIKRNLLIAILLLFVPMAGFSAIPGKYEVQIPFSPPAARSLDQVTVHVVFAFDCGHCYNFHRSQQKALKRKFGNKLRLINQPIGWRGENPGRLYFIAEEEGKGEAVLMTIFDLLFNKGLGVEMFKRDKLQFVAQMNGLTEQFKSRMDSPEIVGKMRKSMNYAKERKIDSTPTVVIENVIFAERDLGNLTTIINALLKKPVS